MGAEETLFGPFLLDRGRMILLRDGKSVAVGQRGLALLDALLHVDRVVSKADLLQAAWPDVVVEENNLTVQIASLRRALGRRPDGQEWIITVPRVGYRLLRSEAGQPAAATRDGIRSSIAVLPFESMVTDDANDGFADGVADDIMTALSRFRSLAVVARSSTLAYRARAADSRQVARELGAQYLLEGSVRRAGDRLRLTVQLIDGASGTHVWAHKFDGGVADIFSEQDRISDCVAAVIEPRIVDIEGARRERSSGSAGLQANDICLQVLKNVDTWSPETNLNAIRMLDRALELDPDLPPALVLGAVARENRHNLGWPAYGENDAATALAMVQRAVDRLDDDAQMLARAAMVLLQTGGDYQRALTLLGRALTLNPHDSVVVHHAGIGNLLSGDLDLAERLFRRAIEMRLKTDADVPMTGLAHIELIRGHYESAMDLANRALTSHPNFNPAHWMLIAAHAHLGQIKAAKRHLEALQRLAPGVTIARTLRVANPLHAARIAVVVDGLRLAGMPDQ